MKFLLRIVVLLGVVALSFGLAKGQNAIVGPGFASGWGNACNSDAEYSFLSAGAGTSYIQILTANGVGAQYFRFGIKWDSTFSQRTITIGSDTLITPGVAYHLSSNCASSGALYLNVTNTSDNYIFKTREAGSNPTGDFVIFRIPGAVRSISSVSSPPTVVPSGQPVNVIAGISGSFTNQQAAYLRYTTDGWNSSVIIPMTGSGTTRSAAIPGSANTLGANIEYYVFTSGSGLTITHADADFFTINLNNGGSNYSYEVQAASDFLLFDSFYRDNYGDSVGVPSSNPGSPWVEYETTVSGARTLGGGLHMGSTTSGREMISFDMSGHYPSAFDQSTDTMHWAWNMRSDRDNPSGFANNNYGSAFILGSNKSNFTDSAAYGYAVVLGGGDTIAGERPLRLIRFKDGLTSNATGRIEEIATIPLADDRSYLNIIVLYNSCDHMWVLKLREDTVFTQPNIGAFPLSASGSDATYTSSDIPFLGVLWNHQTVNNTLRIDNIYIPSPTTGFDVEYTWAGGVSGNFNTANNWSPPRECARNRDRLVFEGGTSEVLEVPNQIIGQLAVQSNADVTLRNITAGSVSTLSLTGGDGQDFFIESGSTLNLDVRTSAGGNGIVLNMFAATTGEIAGILRFNNTKGATPGGQHHQVLVTDTDALHIKNGGRVEANFLLNSNNPFGDDLGLNAVVFEGGSTYLHASGANPFGYNRPNSKVIFESGSLYHFTYAGGTPAMSGRTYANFLFDVNTSKSMGGDYPYFIDTLIVNQGSLTFEHKTMGTIHGDIEVALGAILNFTPSSGTAQILIDAPVIQNIFGAGLLTFGSNTTLNLQNQNRINIQKDININGAGPANILPNAVVDFEGENKFTGSGTTNIQNNSTVYIGSVGGIASSGATGNIQTTIRDYSVETAYIYDGTADQNTGTGLPATLSGNGRLEIDNPGNTVTHTNTLTTTPLLTLTNGLFAVGPTKTLAITAGGTINSSATSNFAAGNLGGTVSFLGTGTVNAADSLDFWNVNLPSGGGGVNFGLTGTPNINNEIVISNGRWVDSNAPFYADGSTLIYNSGGNYGAGAEWKSDTISGRGIPFNVQIGKLGVSNSKLNFTNWGEYRYARNNVTVGHSGVGSGYELKLSDSFGGDLKLDGNMTLESNGQFDANLRAVFFTGSTNQTVTSKTASNDITFDYLVVKKTGGDLLLSDDSPGTTVNVIGAVDNVLVLSGGDIDLQGQTFNFGGTDTLLSYLQVEGSQHVVKSATSSNFNVFAKKEVRAINSGELLFDDSVTVSISNEMNFGAGGITTINATLQIDTGGYANINAPRYGSDGVLKYNTGAEYLRRVEWNGIETNPGCPNDVIVAGGTTLSAGGENGSQTLTPLSARRDVKIEAGSSLYMDYDHKNMKLPLMVGRDLIINGNLSASDSIGGDIHISGNWVRNAGGIFNPKDRQVLFNGSSPQTIMADGGETFDYLAFDSAGTKEFLDDITVNKNIDFYTGSGSLSGDGQTIHLLGNWNNNVGEAAFAEANTTVSFEGNALQEINCSGSAFEGFHNMRMSNSGTGVVLNNAVRIYGNLEFVDGLIDATTHYVDFQPGSSNSGSSQASYINGFASKTGFTGGIEFLFPVGTYLNAAMEIVDVYQPAGLIATTTSTSARFVVDYNHESYFPGAMEPNNLPPMQSPLVKASTCNFWNINRNVPGTDAHVRLYWTDACFDISNPHDLVVAKVDGGQWVSQGPATTSSVIPYTEGSVVTTGPVSNFSPFAIGSTNGLNVLPIQLLSFTASANGRKVETNWLTSTEINNDFFTVERSVDAIHFEEAGRVEGAGNSTSQLSYSFTDDSPFAGISYYRLKQTDFDGKTTYSEIRAVQIDSDKRFELLNVYRSDNEVNLVYRSGVELLNVEVFDLVGKQLFAADIRNETGQNTIRPSLVRGVYLLRLSNGIEVVSRKFFY